MRDDAYHFSLRLEGLEGRNHGFERVAVERTETFVDKKGADGHVLAGQIRQPERQRKTDKEFFAPAHGVHRSGFACLIMIHEFEIEFFARFVLWVELE